MIMTLLSPKAIPKFAFCLIFLIFITTIVEWIVNSNSSEATGSWNIYSNFHASGGKLIDLEYIIEYYKGRGNIECSNGLGTSRFKIDTHHSQHALDLIQLSINTAHNFNPDMSAWAAVNALDIFSQNAIPYVLLCKSLAWNPGFSMAWRQCIEVARDISSRHGASNQEVLYTNVEVCGILDFLSEDDRTACVRQAYLSLMKEYPEDIDAKAFYAWHLVDKSINKFGAPLQPMRSEAQQFLEDLVEHYPWHHGLAHYVIHAWEDTLQPTQALEATRTVMQVCFKSPHMVHMVGHIYYLLGAYQNASAYFSASQRLETCPDTLLQGELLAQHLSQRAPYLPTRSCNMLDTIPFEGAAAATQKRSWCHPFCNSSLHNWEMHHNLAFEIMTLSQMGQMEAVEQWSEMCYQMTPWTDVIEEKVVFPLAYSPMASRALARYYYQCLLAPIDAYLSASMWTRALNMAERAIQHVEAQHKWIFSEEYIERTTRTADAIAKEYVFSAAKDFATIPLQMYNAKREYALLMMSVFEEELVDREDKVAYHDVSSNQSAHSSRRFIFPDGASMFKSTSSIRSELNVSQAKKALKSLEKRMRFLNTSLVELKQGDVSYSVILRNIQALMCSYQEAKGIVMFAENRFKESIEQLQVARNMSPQNIEMSVIPYNEPVVIPRPIAESLAAVYHYVGEVDNALEEYRAILQSPLHAERSWTLLAIGRVYANGLTTTSWNPVTYDVDGVMNHGEACRIFKRLMQGSWRHADKSILSVALVTEFVNMFCSIQ